MWSHGLNSVIKVCMCPRQYTYHLRTVLRLAIGIPWKSSFQSVIFRAYTKCPERYKIMTNKPTTGNFSLVLVHMNAR